MLDALLQDARQALRHLRRSPGFAGAAILTLALGIGANTAVFTILNALVLRPLPIPDPHGLIGVSGRGPQGQLRLTIISAVDELAHEGPLRHVCGYNGGVVLAIEADGTPTRAIGALVTGRCFQAFGVMPFLGRPIRDEDAPLERPGSPVAVVSHHFWTRMLGADPDAVGRTIRTEGVDLEVIGVLPRGFGGLHADSGVDVFTPFNVIFSPPPGRRPGVSHILGRLRPGVPFEQASAELATRWPALLEAVIPATLPPTERAVLREARPRTERIGTGISSYRDRYARPVTLIAGLTGVLLLVACVNLGGLLLSRLAAREPELAVRAALGGSRWRITQQMLVESLLVSLSGAVLAVPLSLAIVAPLASFLPVGLVERTVSFSPDARVLGATVLAGLIAGVLTSALPLWMAARQRVGAHFTWNRTVAGATSPWAKGLLVAQVALSVTMLVGAGLLIRSLYLLQQVDPGVHRDGVLVAQVMPLPNAYRDIDNASYYPALHDRLLAVPGVRAAGFARIFPRLTGEALTQPVAFVGDRPGEVRAVLDTVSPGFFETLGVRLVTGRLPAWADDDQSLQVAVVSESLAKALAPDGGVVGRRIAYGGDRIHQDVAIVGIVANATMGNPRQPDLPVMYRPMLQVGRMANYPSLVIAFDGDLGVAARVRQVLDDAGREYAHSIDTLDGLLTRAPASERMSATLAGMVAGLALLLVFVGVYGLLANAVSRRTREIGVRVAVGAAPGVVVGMVLREGFVLTAAGVAIGLPGALLAARLLRALLFGISEADPIVFAATAASFLLLGVAAGVVPARRAARVDPAVLLRAE